MSSPTLDEGGQGLDGQDQWSQEEENAFLADSGKHLKATDSKQPQSRNKKVAMAPCRQ